MYKDFLMAIGLNKLNFRIITIMNKNHRIHGASFLEYSTQF